MCYKFKYSNILTPKKGDKMYQENSNKKRLFFFILLISFFSFIVSTAHSGFNDCAIDWNKFNSPGYIAEYTYKGESIHDLEDKGSSPDTTHGKANVPPSQTDLASGAISSNPGPKATAYFGYYDGGTPYDPNNPSTMEDDYIFFRMRIVGDPRHGSEFDSYHWNILFDIDGDGYKEYWVDLEGSYSQNNYDRLNILFDDINNQVISDPDRTNPLVRVNYFRAYYNPDNSSTCKSSDPSSPGFSHTRVIRTEDNQQYWIEEQIPMTAFKDSYGNQMLFPDSPVSFVYSTGASNQDPLQKDWMMDLNWLSDADPITFGDVIIPQGTPIIQFTDSNLNSVNYYTIGDNIYIFLRDPRANQNNSQIETIQVTVTNPSTGDDEVITLTETTPSSGIFSNKNAASLLTTVDSDGISNNSDNNGSLEVTSGDTIYVSYTNINSYTVTDKADIIGPCDAYIQFTRANGMPSDNFILTNNVNTSDKLYVTLTDFSANTDKNTKQTITINLTGNDQETLTLTETGNDTGIFRNTTGLNTIIETPPTSPNDGLWEDNDGGAVTATYNYNCGGIPRTKTTTATLFVVPAAGRVYFTNSAGTLDVDIYGPGQQIYIKVDDIVNCGTGSPKTLTVTVSSPVDSNVVTLTETSPGSGVFRNTSSTLITSTYDGSATINDGILEIRNGDTITVTYNDCNDGDNDATNNNKTDTALYNSPDLVINEVLFWPLNVEYTGGEYDPSSVLCQTEYIQLYNTTTSEVNLSAYSVTDGDSFNYTLPNVLLGAGKKAYIALHHVSQNIPPFQDEEGNWYILAPVSNIFPSDELGDPDSIDPADQISLYKSGTIIDYVAWSSTISQSIDFLGDDSDAVAAGIWQDDAFINVSNIIKGQAITRVTPGYDVNSIQDWTITSDTLIACRTIVTRSPISNFKAYVQDGKVVVEWETASETKTVGFYLLRYNKKTNSYEKVNKALLPATLDSPQGGLYKLIDSEASIDEISSYKLIEVEHSGKENTYGPFPISEDLNSSSPKNIPVVSCSFVDGNNLKPFWRVSKRTLALKDLEIQNLQEKYTVSTTDTKKRKGNAAKLSILNDGLYFVDASEIAKAMNTSRKDIINRIKKNSLSLSCQGNPISYLPEENGNGIFFYGSEINNVVSPENIYWLKKENGTTMQQLNGGAPIPVEYEQAFTESIHIEQNHFDTTSIFTDPSSDYWMWKYFVAGDSSLDKNTFIFPIKDLSSSNDNPSIRVNLIGGTATNHHATIKINGVEIGNLIWNGINPYSQDISFERSLLKEGDNSLEVTALLDEGVSYSIFYLDSFDVTYKRLYKAVDNKLLCKGNGNPIVTVSGFTNQNIKVFDITDKNKPIIVTGITIDGSEGNYRVSFIPASPDTPYLVTTLDNSLKVERILTDVPSNLKSSANSADYIIITTEEFEKAVKGLEKQKKSMKLKTKVVLIEDIMDEFNYGITNPNAIKDFLSYAYDNWKSKPKYVLLTGKGSYDYKNYQGFNKNLIPPAMVATDDGLFPSDNYLADINNDHIPEIIIGRIPASTTAELTTAIQKIIIYEKTKNTAWKTNIILTADKPNEGETFPFDSDEIASLIPHGYSVKKIYLSEGSLSSSRQDLINNINEGALLLNYIGHAGIDRLTQSGLLTSEDISLLTNSGKLPVFATMTCLTALFAIPGNNCLAESFLISNNYGAIAFWAPTGMSDNYEAKLLNKEFIKSLLKGGKTILGDAIKEALNNYKSLGGKPYMMDIYTLIGDPALSIKK